MLFKLSSEDKTINILIASFITTISGNLIKGFYFHNTLWDVIFLLQVGKKHVLKVSDAQLVL